MRQVPCYLLIGQGKVARHFHHYFNLLQLSHQNWHRHESLSKLNRALQSASHVLLLIKDDVIESFITQYCTKTCAILIHFSGSLTTEKAFGAHPLMTFNASLYDLAHYQSIPFIIDHDAPSFENLLPGLSNPHVRLEKSLKAKYHALCVLSGNFSCLLWQKFFTALQDELHIPPSFAHPYLMQQMQNLLQNSQDAFTGPLARNDHETINKNLAALASDPFQEIYKSFLSCYQKIKGT
jgi:2-dehydropantoate 2-reductase